MKHSLSPIRAFWLDYLRGSAIIAMFAYHFCFDLIHFGYPFFSGSAANMNHHPVWLGLRTFIVGSFILISGVSQGFRYRTTSLPSFIKLLKTSAPLLTGAALVSLGSFFSFPNTWIDFGVLHFFVVTRFLSPSLSQYSILKLIVLGITLGAISFLHHRFFDSIPWRWIGFTTHKPLTEDYVPLIPWLCVFIIGLILAKGIALPMQTKPIFPLKPLAWIGQHSLAIYLIHQPLLWAGFTVIAQYPQLF